jgi:phage replication initiation protein
VSEAKRAQARDERTRAKRSDSPPSLTGGKETPKGAKVDWCTVTWFPDPDEHIPATVHSLLLGVIGNVQGVSCAGMFGYQSGVRFFVDIAGTPHHIARVDFGGNHHKGRARLDLFGSACGVVKDWSAVRSWIGRQFEAKLTRVDLAVDCLLGEFTVEHARDWYLAGDFRSDCAGKQPRHSLIGDWLDPQYGRTLEVGRRENGKMCRVYEKGRQLGDSLSQWTRFEVEIRNHERDLPLDVLTSPDRYFVGAYRCLQRVLDVAGERIACRKREGEIALDRLTLHARSSYGQLIQVLRLKLTAAEVLDALQRPGVPGRLSKSSLAEFTTADSPAAFLKAHHETQRHRL